MRDLLNNIPSQPPPSSPQPSFRSGAVARLSGMPVATLRVWEQRYQAIKPTTAPSGHRLYSAADVERAGLLRQLTAQGHAISALAGLATELLRGLSSVDADGSAQLSAARPERSAPLRIVVVGQAMAMRLQRGTARTYWGKPAEVVGIFDSLNDARMGAVKSEAVATDLLLWQASDLQADALPELKAVQRAWQAHAVAVSYRFSSSVVRNTYVQSGAHIAREPADDDALGAWLATLASRLGDGADVGGTSAKNTAAEAWSLGALGLSESPVPLRRFDDAGLTAFAGLASRVACECPGHVAELLLQISSFEAYSASCSNQSPADADLHAYVHRVAGAARILFESALERIALAEGFALPSKTRPDAPSIQTIHPGNLP